ncbi:hypothetical protein Tco_1134344 [Tanacetum coccineum]
MVDATELSTFSGTPSTVERSPLDFANEDAPPPGTQGIDTRAHGLVAAEQGIPMTDDAGATEVTVGPNLAQEIISMGPTLNKKRRQRDAGEEGPNAPAKVLRKDHDIARTEHSACRGKSLAGMSVDIRHALHAQKTQEPPLATQTVNDPNPLSSAKEKGIMGGQDFERSSPSPPITGSPRSIYQPGQVAMGSQPRLRFKQEAKLLKKSVAQVARRDQRIASREKHIKELEAQLKSEIDMKKATEVKNSEVIKELEDLRMRFSGLEHEDERVSAWCAEMDARLDTLSVDFDEELYPHMLTAIAGCRWVIGHGLRLAVMKYAESTELRQAFSKNLVPRVCMGYPGMSEGFENMAWSMGKLDAPLDVIMASLYLESDTGEDAPQFIRGLLPSSSQLKILVYLEVRDPRNHWACKEEILLRDAIVTNISHAEKKKKSRVVCRTHGVGSAHHARSDGIPVLVPTVAPQGL